jgi:PTS system fructose-specific IIC component
MKLTEFLDERCVKVPMAAKDKIAAITELVDLLTAHGPVSDREALLQAVLEREDSRSTGIGQGLAIPHGKTSACKRLCMAIGKPAEALDFDSLDGKPVRVVALLAGPADQAGPHIQALARICRLMTIEEFRQALENAKTSEELYRVIASSEG